MIHGFMPKEVLVYAGDTTSHLGGPARPLHSQPCLHGWISGSETHGNNGSAESPFLFSASARPDRAKAWDSEYQEPRTELTTQPDCDENNASMAIGHCADSLMIPSQQPLVETPGRRKIGHTWWPGKILEGDLSE